jgi:GNAT superfamily N-acetyltransferase
MNVRAEVATDYDLRPLEANRTAVIEAAQLLRTVFPGAKHFSNEVVEWEYLQNPDGKAIGRNAYVGNELAAHYVALPMLARVNGAVERGLLSLNTATHVQHQGKGLFTKLAQATYADAAQQGYGFVIGVANASSTPGFVRKLGFQLVAPLRAMVGIGKVRTVDPGPVQYARQWSPEALAWRLAHPYYRYSVKRRRYDEIVFSERTSAGARHILAVLPRDRCSSAVPAHKGPTPFRMWIGLDCGFNWTLRPYVNVPMRFRPAPLNLIFKDLTGVGRRLDPDRVQFQAIDFDVL